MNTAGERDKALGPGGAYEALEQARAEGKGRFIGVTGHDWEQVAKAVATGKFDTVLCWYNCALRQAESTVFEEAQKHNTGVVIMNASARGGAGGTVSNSSKQGTMNRNGTASNDHQHGFLAA